MNRCPHERVSVIEYATTPLFFDVLRRSDGTYARHDDGSGEPAPSGSGRVECEACGRTLPFPRRAVVPAWWPAWAKDAFHSTPPGGNDWPPKGFRATEETR